MKICNLIYQIVVFRVLASNFTAWTRPQNKNSTWSNFRTSNFLKAIVWVRIRTWWSWTPCTSRRTWCSKCSSGICLGSSWLGAPPTSPILTETCPESKGISERSLNHMRRIVMGACSRMAEAWTTNLCKTEPVLRTKLPYCCKSSRRMRKKMERRIRIWWKGRANLAPPGPTNK